MRTHVAVCVLAAVIEALPTRALPGWAPPTSTTRSSPPAAPCGNAGAFAGTLSPPPSAPFERDTRHSALQDRIRSRHGAQVSRDDQ